MCHNAPWLSALDKQMRLQFAPKKSKAEAFARRRAIQIDVYFALLLQLSILFHQLTKFSEKITCIQTKMKTMNQQTRFAD